MSAVAGSAQPPGEPLWARLQGWWPALVLVVVTAASAWFLAELERDHDTPEASSGRSPDFYLRDFDTVNHDADGRLQRRLRARHLAYFPQSGSSELEAPSLTLYQIEGTPWRVESERGWLSESGQVLLLLGEVRIWRMNESGQRLLDLQTRDLRVIPGSNYVETDNPVTITSPHSRTTGTGLRGYMDLGRLELLSDVKSIYLRNAYLD